MTDTLRIPANLPAAADPAVAIVRTLTGAGHQALLAGGCVRDLLLGLSPQDYDVATDAPPERVGALFPATRQVGAQFGVVLVKQRRRWVEVATFRCDGPYLDGRRPATVTLTDAQHDALRRDFTVNGMFLDPLALRVIDYVGGQVDLAAGVIRAIGDPAARFGEDHLRLLRAVRFAARLGFAIEPVTLAAIREHAPKLARVAPERVREELEKMLGHATRGAAWGLLRETGLLPHLWPEAGWEPGAFDATAELLRRLPPDAPFELALAVLLADRTPREIERIARALTLSNEQRETTAWLVAHARDLDDPSSPTLADLKRRMAHAAFPLLRQLAAARHARLGRAAERQAALCARLAAIPPDAVQPPPLITGEDLIQRGLPPGPRYKDLLDRLYTRQLDEQIRTRDDALRTLDDLLAAPPATPPTGSPPP
ncbi:MAG: CCA tRNA nucleotidyltransferase [Planctomycetota bacterium]